MRRSILLLAWVMTTVIGSTACTNDPTKVNAAETIKIGVIYPLSGPDTTAGEDLQAGILLASEIVNESFDLSLSLAKEKGLPEKKNAKVEFLFRDSLSDPDTAANWVEKLVNEDRVRAIIGCYSSTVTAMASARAEMLGVPFLSAVSTSPTLTQRGFKWFFRTTPHDAIFAQNFFEFFSNLETQKKIEIPKRLILVFENRLWGTNVANAERNLALRHDFTVVAEVPYDYKETDFTEELKQIKAAMPGVILQASYDKDAVSLLKGYKATDIRPEAILGMDSGFISSRFLSALGGEAEGILSREVWSLDLSAGKPLVKDVNDLYLKRFGRNMTGYSARSFTAAVVLADALNRARSLDPDPIREALKTTDIKGEQLIMPWDGVRFDPETGQNMLGKGIIVQVQQGAYRTIWPWDLAERPVVWPMPKRLPEEGEK
jgi:branched-chain amino acid transport system substrate-binding protein